MTIADSLFDCDSDVRSYLDDDTYEPHQKLEILRVLGVMWALREKLDSPDINHTTSTEPLV